MATVLRYGTNCPSACLRERKLGMALWEIDKGREKEGRKGSALTARFRRESRTSNLVIHGVEFQEKTIIRKLIPPPPSQQSEVIF